MSAMLTGGGFVTQPPDDVPTASQSTLLLQKKKEMAEVQQQLERKKEEFRARMQRCQEKEVDLAARQEDIKEQVRKFDKFLKDNDAKRVRADRKVQEERRARDQKEHEKLHLLQEFSIFTEKRTQLKQEVETKGKFQRFLDSVCEDPSESFESIENIMMRYETLKAAHDDLRDRVDAAQRQQEDENAQLVQFMKRSQNDLLVYNSDIAMQQQELDMLRYKTSDGEAALYRGENEAKEGTRQLGEIKMAIHNIHNRCLRVRAANAPEDLGQFLEAIKQRVVDLQAIVTGHEGPLQRQELMTLIRNRNPAPPEEALGSSKPGAKQADSSFSGAKAAVGGSNVSPGSMGDSRAPRSSFRQSGAAADGTHGSQSMSASGMSGGPISKVRQEIA
jgi:hypothetical protein